MKRVFCIVLGLMLFMCSFALAEGFAGFEGVLIVDPDKPLSEALDSGTDPKPAGGAPAGDDGQLAVSLSDIAAADIGDGMAQLGIDIQITNWDTATLSIADSLSATLTYQDKYTYSAELQFQRESISMMERLSGKLQFTVPYIVAFAAPDELELSVIARGEETLTSPDFRTATRELKAATEMPFDYDSAQSDILEIAPIGVDIATTYNYCEYDVAALYALQKVKLINWSTKTVTLDVDTLKGYIVCYGKYAFPGTFEFPVTALEPLQAVDCMLAVKLPVTAPEAGAEDTELWISSGSYEYRGNTDLNTAYGEFKAFVDSLPEDAVEWNGHWYKLCNIGNVSWADARAYCREQGGYLATITSQAENDFIYNNLLLPANARDAFFGFIKDPNNTKVWSWETGEAIDYTNWHSGEPDTSSGSYASLYKDAQWYDWNFGYCTRNFICEWGR